ncbi:MULTISPECIES: DNA methyltransferase [unclassified Simplicispira]|uniref:class I SAM-dependent DNA methyltransferase n=1 Tax=unclassified Simplicispira TaxID=2630407 RepID=UPI000D5F6C52|nr:MULTISPECIES: DNA methyltransferase [unclassified Simplicispira]PVY55627.1 type II restriction/modification system DNA methylase subunit YeeA [Simplicispira sp. 125]REG16570.1 type II restriction/modification system DNA methylase subunit YeeA [Simplicispira sp. 110]
MGAHNTATGASAPVHSAAAQDFIARWSGTTASELATAQSFVIDLCALLGMAKPHPTPEQDYMFERPVTFAHGDGSTSAGRIDCYRRGHFVLEAKKLKAGSHTKGFDDGLLRARSQGEGYARALPAHEGRPPFVLVVDVGTVIEVYAEFSKTGGTYTPYPDPRSHRLQLADLARPEVQDRLRRIWQDPDSLNPARISAQVTRDVSALLARLAKSLESPVAQNRTEQNRTEQNRTEQNRTEQNRTEQKLYHKYSKTQYQQSLIAPEIIASYLTRCLFSMFAEDVELLPKGAFLGLLQTHRNDPATLQQMLRILWADMDRGGFSAALAKPVLHFNGKLFKGAGEDGYSLLLTPEQIDLLIAAAKSNWREVEPAIFGTLLERALDPAERHALGAHYTPRAYVERLVLPTVIEPLRADWANAQAAALVLAHEAAALQGKAMEAKLAEARAEVKKFHHQLCATRVLDPACGSANFLYVTLEHLKRLEGEVVNQLEELGHTQDQLGFEGETVTLQQLRGIELNERAAALAELVLWIGYLQWHIRTRGNTAVAEPVVHNYGNIECRDAVLAWDAQELAYDDADQLLSRWDGTTFKTHPVTGELVPDEAAQVPQWRYVGARKAQWPQADFIVGNPPFIGNKRMRDALGDGYVQALRGAWPEIPESADFVMFWWHHAAAQVTAGQTRRMGLITTNSLTMIFNRRVVQAALDQNTHLEMAISDHPWVDSANGAAVRIAMTALAGGAGDGRLHTVMDERPGEHGETTVEMLTRTGLLHADLSLGANVAKAQPLRANAQIANRGVIPHGAGFIVTKEQAAALGSPSILREYRNGRDLTDAPRGVRVIDAFGFSAEDLRTQYPAVYQWLLERVKPDRDQNPRPKRRDYWWRFAEDQPRMRQSVASLDRYIATGQVSKHRVFQFLDASILPDDKLIAIALDDAFSLGVLSSQLHVCWALALGGRLGVGNDPVYSKSTCFDTFPFPDEDTGLTPPLRERIAQLAEQIDAHRKRVLAPESGNTGLTLTGIYNVLAALREGRALTAKEKTQHTQGLVGVLRELHDELDAAVLAAYGLPATASTDDILAYLVQLNTQRAQEEAQGRVRWLRPDFQNPQNSVQKQELLAQDDQAPEADFDSEKSLSKPEQTKPAQHPWPATLPEQVRAVADALAASPIPLTLSAIEARFKGRGPWKKGLPTLLQTLEALGRAQAVATGGEVAWRG